MCYTVGKSMKNAVCPLVPGCYTKLAVMQCNDSGINAKRASIYLHVQCTGERKNTSQLDFLFMVAADSLTQTPSDALHHVFHQTERWHTCHFQAASGHVEAAWAASH